MVKTFGRIDLVKGNWILSNIKPHVCIKLKTIFQKIPKTDTAPFKIADTLENCEDLRWFTDRYPMLIPVADGLHMKFQSEAYRTKAGVMEEILSPDYVPILAKLNDGLQPRPYQQQAADMLYYTERLLLGDDIGLGKTLSAILSMLKPGTLPVVVVVQTHLTRQWKDEIERFTNLRVHIIKGRKPYSLPPVDVYIIRYSCLAAWVDVFESINSKTAIFDEVQELRRPDSNKYVAAKKLAELNHYCMGMSATPVYNFGDEVFHIMNLIKPMCLGPFYDFIREWGTTWNGRTYKIEDPKALGAYLRDNYLFLRRTMTEVGRELPPINRIVHTVGFDQKEVDRIDTLATTLAMKIMSGSFIEQGSAARELDLLVRQSTGVAKAREVAAYVRILLENNEPVVLGGWHREVYEIWKEELAEFNPVFYTGTESDVQKRQSKEDFISGKTNLFIMSIRSGVGLDGLQKRCRVIVVGELDWSPAVHEQFIGRVNRDGQDHQVMAIFLTCDYGSDPVIIDLLGLKSSQAFGIVNPLAAGPDAVYSDDSRIKTLATRFLQKNREN